jgi:hypothetical protein
MSSGETLIYWQALKSVMNKYEWLAPCRQALNMNNKRR